MTRRLSADTFSVKSLAPLSMQSGDPHPEEWTLVNVHKMEKREPFQTWLTNLQANILNCARKINDSLEEHPHPNVNLSRDALEHSRYVIDSERDRIMTEAYYERRPTHINTAHYKVAREEDVRLYRGL